MDEGIDKKNTDAEREDLHQTIRTMSLGALWRVLRYPFILFSMVFIPRMMGDSDYGSYAYFISLFVILDMVTDLGFQQIFGRFVPECNARGDRRGLRGLLHGMLAFGVGLAVLLVVALFFVYTFRPRETFSLQWIVLLSLILLLTRIEGTLFSLLYGLNQIARFSFKEVLRSASTLVLVLVLYHFFGLKGALWGLVGNEIILCLVSMLWTRAFLFQESGRIRFSAMKPYLVFGVGFYVPALFYGLLQRSGNVFVKLLTQSAEDVAYYDVANQYLLLTLTFMGLIFQTLLPALTKLHIGNDPETIDRWQRTIMTYCAVLAFFSFNALMWLGEPVIVLCLGDTFRPVTGNARIISLAVVPGLIAYSGMNYALLHRAPGVYIRAVIAGTVAMSTVSLLSIPRWQAAGAAWATVAGYTALGLVFLVHYAGYFRIILRQFWMALALAVLFLPLYRIDASDRQAVAWFAVSSALYSVLLVVLRIARWSDLQKILRAFQRAG